MLLPPPPTTRWTCTRSLLRSALSLPGPIPRSRPSRTPRLIQRLPPRTYTTSPRLQTALTQLERTRNIGIIAHIDAGKTTTTERMLYYSGHTRVLGDVDDGSTVTDFLPAERARGITIQSAAITFHWPPKPPAQEGEAGETTVEGLRARGVPRSVLPHTINLIDTPGHADFTFEVLRSLRILDGAVCILDGVAGVEAQTEKVWHQASRYAIPRLVFVNKLDREGAAFGRTVKEIAGKLGGWPAVCQVPWFGDQGRGKFQGVGDVMYLRGLRWDEGGDGKKMTMLPLEELDRVDQTLAGEIRAARVALVELLAEQDELLVEKFLEADGEHLALTPLDLIDSLRRCLRRPAARVIPVFAGASFRNIGVQPLLDAVVNLLPSPTERPDPEVSIGNRTGGLQALLEGKFSLDEPAASTPTKKPAKKSKKTALASSAPSAKTALARLEACALAFKVALDPKRGVLVYVRVYAGTLTRNAALYNTALRLSERGPRLLQMFADAAVEVESVAAGNIAVITGLKYARTGDTLLQFPGNKPVPPHPVDSLQLRPIDVPPAVFFASVEPLSLAEEKHLHEALQVLLREDPSLHVSLDEESGQTLLAGMGELHLEIARDRLVKDLKAKAQMGSISIGYRECISAGSGDVARVWDKEVAGKKGKAGCIARVEPLEYAGDAEDVDGVLASELVDGNRITIVSPALCQVELASSRQTAESVLPPHLTPSIVRLALTNGALAALARGPRFAFPMHDTALTLTVHPEEHVFGTDSTPAAISAAARAATQAALREVVGAAGVMEPVMNVTISVNEGSMGAVIHDVSSSRGGHILALDEGDGGDSHTESDSLPPIQLERVYAPPDPFSAGTATTSLKESTAGAAQRQIKARVPLKEMVGYLKHLRSLTQGRGTFVMSVDRFEKMGGQREKALVAEMRGGGW